MFIKDSGSLNCYLLETVNSLILISVVQFLQCLEVSFVDLSQNPNFVITHGEVLMGRHCYALLKRHHDVLIRYGGDAPLRHLGDILPRRR